MKKNVLLVLMCMFAITTYAKKETSTVTFNVPLDCENCVKKVESNIAFEKGVKDIACSLEDKTVAVTYLPEKTNVENLKKGFAKIGYDDVTEKKACCSGEKTKACSEEVKKSSCCSKEAEKKSCCSQEKAHHEGEDHAH